MSDWDEDAGESTAQPESFEGLMKPLIDRLDSAEFEWSIETPPATPSRRLLRFSVPTSTGGAARVAVTNEEKRDLLLRSAFERCVRSSTFDAISRLDDGYFEGRVVGLDVPGTRAAVRKLLGGDVVIGHPFPVAKIQGTPPGLAIELGPWSDEFRALGMSFASASEVSITILGLVATDYGDLERQVVDITNALFFNIDLGTGVALNLGRRLSPRPVRRGASQTTDLVLPNWRYDRQPMELYWYGRSATRMPLLQYLAFYQVLEFFFPVFSRAEALRRVRRLLKSPNFSASRDSDVARVFQVVGSGASRAYGDERAQLKATVDECTADEELREFIEADDERLAFLTTKVPTLTEFRLDLGRRDSDLRTQVSGRIYDIRCRIVHTKGASEVELLLPFSEEASLLRHDILLVEFIAQQALVVASNS